MMTEVRIILLAWLTDLPGGDAGWRYSVQTDGMSNIFEVINHLKSRDPGLKAILDRGDGELLFLLNGRHINQAEKLEQIPPVCEITVVPPLSGG